MEQDLQMAIGLRLGLPVCLPHKCRNCGSKVDQFGLHGLSCHFGRGKFLHHNSINEIIKRTLESVKVPSVVEPSGISRLDGKRPDGTSLIAWSQGKPLVWDVTCPNPLAASHINSARIREQELLLMKLNAKRRGNMPVSQATTFHPCIHRNIRFSGQRG